MIERELSNYVSRVCLPYLLHLMNTRSSSLLPPMWQSLRSQKLDRIKVLLEASGSAIHDDVALQCQLLHCLRQALLA